MKHTPLSFALISTRLISFLAVLAVLGGLFLSPLPVLAQGDNPNPPEETVRLIFVHHSTGENWLSDSNGGLGRALSDNNYFVSDTNYGWGPHSIGDATDIPNWVDWFRSENTQLYTEALFNESEQNAPYSRTLSNPGGENEVIMFKSCFPNSELEGNPSDPPDPDGWLSVGHAKYVYNEILQYFITRPDKLFVVITAPPLSDGTYANNARAFNQWLVNDWLAENNYPYNNVAVFDFYNILTAPENHHRFVDGAVEHSINDNRNTLYYPSGDDHPSQAGNRKATEEFVPMLNVFYHRWRDTMGDVVIEANPPAAEGETSAEESSESQPPAQSQSGLMPGGFIDNFDSGTPANTEGWTAYSGDGEQTTIESAIEGGTAHSGEQAMRLRFMVEPGAWATCVLGYSNFQDFSASDGVTYYIHADQAGIPYDFIVYRGESFAEAYLYYTSTTQESVDGWAQVQVPWDQFFRASWEENAGAPIGQLNQVTGFAIGFDGLDDGNNSGTIWIDDIQLTGAAAQSEQPAEEAAPQDQEQPAADSQEEQPAENVAPPTSAEQPQSPAAEPQDEEESGGGLGGMCPLSTATILMVPVVMLWNHKKNRHSI